MAETCMTLMLNPGIIGGEWIKDETLSFANWKRLQPFIWSGWYKTPGWWNTITIPYFYKLHLEVCIAYKIIFLVRQLLVLVHIFVKWLTVSLLPYITFEGSTNSEGLIWMRTWTREKISKCEVLSSFAVPGQNSSFRNGQFTNEQELGCGSHNFLTTPRICFCFKGIKICTLYQTDCLKGTKVWSRYFLLYFDLDQKSYWYYHAIDLPVICSDFLLDFVYALGTCSMWNKSLARKHILLAHSHQISN